MRKITGFLIVSIMLTISTTKASIYYVSTSGNDANPGTISEPFLTWEKLNSILRAGDIAYIRGGIYRINKAANIDYRIYLHDLSGNSLNPIKIWAYPGEFPIVNFDNILCTGNPIGFLLKNSSYVHIKGLRFTGLAQNSLTHNSCWVFSLAECANCIVEQCEVDHSAMYGFTNYNSNNTLFLNCDAHHLDDPYSPHPHGGSNGFNTGQNGNTSTNVTLRGCRAWWCSDDGYDDFRATGTDGTITYENCWAFLNGYIPGTFNPGGDGSGFKLGATVGSNPSTVLRTLTNCVSFQNYQTGFNQNVARCLLVFYNCTAYANGNAGFQAYSEGGNIPHVLKNNIAYANGSFQQNFTLLSAVVQTNNTWNGGVTVSDADFLSLNNAGVDRPRQEDGSLPKLNFLHLAANSKLIDAGVSIGSASAGINIDLPIANVNIELPFLGSAPDLGAFEYSDSTSVNQSPLANAGIDTTIILPINNITLIGKGTDVDGTVVSYQWSKVSGPAQGTINNSSQAQTIVSNLTPGIYVFELKITDNQNAPGRDSIQINVDSVILNHDKNIKVNIFGGANPYNNTEWNNWNVNASANSSLFNYSDGSLSSVNANLNYGQLLIDNLSSYGGEMAAPEVLRYASYFLKPRALTITGLINSKTYNIELYASRNSDPDNYNVFKIGEISDSVFVNNNFSDKATFTNIKPDAQGQIIIYISSPIKKINYINGFVITENINADSISSKTFGSGEIGEEIITKDNSIVDNQAFLKIYPNPIKDNFTLEVNNSYSGKMSVQIIDQAGAVRHLYSVNKDQQNIRINLNTNDLPSGIYFIRLQIGNWSETRKLLKL